MTRPPDDSRARHRSRAAAVQLLYQWQVGRIAPAATDDALALIRSGGPAPRRPAPDRARVEAYAVDLACGAIAALPTVDPLIARHAEHWRPERMALVDRLIMRLAVYEMLFIGTPPPVVINEALELAKTFSGERAVGFINGVLDGVRAARPAPDDPPGTRVAG